MQFSGNTSYSNSSRTADSPVINIESIDENQPTTSDNTVAKKSIEQRSYQTWYSREYEWLVHVPNTGRYCSTYREYWKPSIPFFREMEQKTKGVFASVPFTNWKKAPGNGGKLKKHAQSPYHRSAIENIVFCQQETSVVNQLLGANETERRENRDRMGDVLDCSYYLFKNELPYTTLYNSSLKAFARVDHSGKLANFFEKCHKNDSYDSTTTVTDLLETTNKVIENDILDKIRRARVFSVMSDEGTDINRHGNLSICIRYCDQSTGEPIETFVTLLQVKNRDAESIFDSIVKKMKHQNLPMKKIRFAAFDGTAVFSGVHNGVAAKIPLSCDCSLLFIYCRAHTL